MKQYRISDAARIDLEEIWMFIAQEDPLAADRFLGALISRFPLLADAPEAGRRRGELLPGLRSLAFRNYIIFYRIGENETDIVRVLHGARDLPPLFE